MTNTTYNLTAFENITDPAQLIAGVNANSGNLFGPLIMLSIGIVAFVILAKRTADIKKAFAGASFITSVVAIMLWSAGILSQGVIFYPIACSIVGIFLIVFKG